MGVIPFSNKQHKVRRHHVKEGDRKAVSNDCICMAFWKMQNRTETNPWRVKVRRGEGTHHKVTGGNSSNHAQTHVIIHKLSFHRPDFESERVWQCTAKFYIILQNIISWLQSLRVQRKLNGYPVGAGSPSVITHLLGWITSSFVALLESYFIKKCNPHINILWVYNYTHTDRHRAPCKCAHAPVASLSIYLS